MRIRTVTLAIICLAVAAGPSRADSPLPPPQRHTVKSPDGSITAISDPRTKTTRIEKTATGTLLWQLPSWERWLFVANDGKHLVTGYPGMNLIPKGYGDQMPLFTFWRQGKKIKEVTFKEFVPDKRILIETISHFNWGQIERIEGGGTLVVKRADGKVFRYNLETGLEVKPGKSPAS
jgi:hypothetical protein